MIMTTTELISHLVKQTNLTKKATKAVLESLVQAIHQTMREKGEVRIHHLGTFKVTERTERPGVNPRTGAKITIPARKVPSFRPAKALREAAQKRK